MPRNPSELERLEQERAFYLRELRRYKSKAAKAQILGALREVERQLGIKSKNYNSGEFDER